jgi:DNA-binding MarR family transcriptional regulator
VRIIISHYDIIRAWDILPEMPTTKPARFRRQVSEREYEMLASFRHALRRFLSFSEEAAREVGLTPQQHQALLAIKGAKGGEVTVGHLADALQIKHHSAVGLIDRLVEQGLATRVPAAADRRQVLVTLTAHGLDLLAELTSAHRHELRRVGPELRTLLTRLAEDDESVA